MSGWKAAIGLLGASAVKPSMLGGLGWGLRGRAKRQGRRRWPARRLGGVKCCKLFACGTPVRALRAELGACSKCRKWRKSDMLKLVVAVV